MAVSPRCETPGELEPEASSALSLVAGAEVRYRTAWSWDGATRSEADDAWVFTTDRGYTVGLERVQMGLGTLQLVPCLQAATGAGWVAAARADHGLETDPTSLAVAAIEDAGDPEAAHGPVPAAGHDYCGLHLLFTPVEVRDGPSAASARVDGWVRSPSGEERRVDATSWLSDGAKRPLQVFAAEKPETHATVTVTRYPARALDGEELDALSDAELAYAFLRGLAQTTEVSVIAE